NELNKLNKLNRLSKAEQQVDIQSSKFKVQGSKFRNGRVSSHETNHVSRFTHHASRITLPSTAGPFDDPAIWRLIANVNARAVHHIESPAMISLCKMCNVHDIDTLIAIVSVIRPGAANESKKMEFARRYQKP